VSETTDIPESSDEHERDEDVRAAGGAERGADENDEKALEPGRPALSEEIARRWDPGRLLRMVGRGAGRGEPLDAATRARFEGRLGVDLGGVRVYTGEFAEKVTTQHSAEAVTVGGTGMIFMSGTPDRSPATSAGRALLAHELTHVAQSSRGIYRSAPDERPPLATEEHEAEAEAVEAEEAQLAGGGGDDGKVDLGRAQEELVEVVTGRVLHLLYEDERVTTLRNGDSRHRP
jgi:hypothetical protein